MNNQPIEKKILNSSGSHLDIVSVFSTIQGEGPFTGHRAVFVRLAGCNLRCPGCDTDYTTGRSTLHIKGVIGKIKSLMKSGLVVITGGEPFRQKVCLFANQLVCEGYTVQIETNGTLPPSVDLMKEVIIVCSPKAGKINPLIAKRANCFKYVLHADSVHEDGLPIKALNHKAHPIVGRPPKGSKVPVYLQPMDSYNEAQNRRNLSAVLESCMAHGYILQLQIHKFIGVE